MTADVPTPLWERDFPGRATVEMYAYTDFSHFARWAGTLTSPFATGRTASVSHPARRGFCGRRAGSGIRPG